MPSARSPATTGAITAISSPPMAPPSPACGLSPATAMRGSARPKSSISARWVIRSVASSSSRVSAPGTWASGTWTVTGTTRSAGAASIITGSGAPDRCARYSVWPGKAKPAPSFSARLLIGLVQSASARPSRANATPRAMISTTAGALAGSGRPGGGRAGQGVVQHRQAVRHRGRRRLGRIDRPDRQAAAGRRAPPRARGRRSGRTPCRSRSAAQAFSAISPPMPAGSPSVRATGFIARR